LEKNSLSKINNNKYVENQINKIETLAASKITIKTVGKSYATYITPCTCKKPSYYILITNYISIDSPITCGSCHKPVPLYRLPQYYDFGYMPILSWETNYQSCDRLQMNCEVGERWALNQMQETKSQLSKQGITICKKIEELTKIPTYYYLHNYKKHKAGDENRHCPICKKQWKLKTILHNRYDFKCDHCHIVSTISPNT
jgi:predicted  nucleic acid-binding Zn ribbon protein